MSKTSSIMNQQQQQKTTFNNDNVNNSLAPPNDRFNALTTTKSNNNNKNKPPRNSFVKKLPTTATSTASRTTSATSSNNSTTTTKDNNKHGLTSMQRFWLEHIVIDRKIIPLSKLRPTVGVLPWADSGAPKKFNKWCKNILQEGHCRFGDTCFNAHPGDGYTIEQLDEESHDISVLEKGTHQPQSSNSNKNSNKTTTTTKTVATISDNSNNTNEDRFASLLLHKKRAPSAPQEHNSSVSRSHTVLSHDDVFNDNDNEEQHQQKQQAEDDSMTSFSRTASPHLTFDTAMLGTAPNNNNNSSSNKQQEQEEHHEEEENYVSVWRQRGNYAVKYPLSHFNEKSLANHKLGKTVVECYFQQGCKDPTCTFLHMKPELIVRVNENNNTEKSKKSSTSTSKSSSSSENNNSNKQQSSDLVQLLEMIKLQDNSNNNNNNNNKLKLIRG